jgi:NO-binding membrane sensor protein with MHYT domain/serine phosphatase RsbU (regulator of sigma subunit)
MQGTYNLWLVAISYLVAVGASYAALQLGARMAHARGRAVWAWMITGSAAMGMGIWSMHFIGMLALHLPIALAYDMRLTLLSMLPAIGCSAIVLWLLRHGTLDGRRLEAGAVLLGTGIAVMHYIGMSAVRIAPELSYHPGLFFASIGVAIILAHVALKLSFALSARGSSRDKAAAALVLGSAVVAMHYTGMAATSFAPDSICTVPSESIDSTWLAVIIAFNVGLTLIAAIAVAGFDARFADQNAGRAAQLEEANAALAGYHMEEEQQKRIAKQLVEHINRAAQDPQGQVASWVMPAQYFSGDLVAIARTPANALHVLLGDGTGHGLAAALSTLPVVQPFCAMTEKGFTIGTLAREINRKIRATLPVGRFVAAAIVSIDPQSGLITVWNGGSPLCSLLDAQGKPVQRFRSAHMPLGILDDASFDSAVESAHYQEDYQLFIASDGLIEAQNESGEAFGEERALQIIADALPSVRLRALRAAVYGHLGAATARDDICAVLVNCSRGAGFAAAA